MINIETKADPSIMQALKRAEMGPLRRMLRRRTKPAAKPALAEIRSRTPVKAGKLRASWGISAFFDNRSGSVGVTIEPRSSFTFKDTSGDKRLVTRRGRAHKSVVAANAKGVAVDRADAWKYAYGIETGHSPKGRLSRRSGGAKMLEHGLPAGAQPFISTINDDVRKHIVHGTV